MAVKPGCKRTEVGIIPDEWNALSLGEVLIKGRLGGNYENQDIESELPLMKMGNLARGCFDLSKVQFIRPGVAPEPVHQLRCGDVLFNTRNTLDLVGKVAIWRDELPVAYYNSNLMRLEFDPEKVCSNDYANYALNTEGVISRLRGLATGTTSVAAIYTRDLLKLQVPVPPLSEQRAIATALCDVEALLRALERLIAKRRNLQQAVMQKLLTGQARLPGFSTSESEAFQKTDVGEIPRDWVVRQLGELVDQARSIRYGIVQPGKYDPNGRLMIRGQDYSKGWVDPSEFFRVSVSVEERYENARVATGDLIMTIVGAGTGHVEAIPHWLNGANLTQTTARIAVDTSKADSVFVKYMLRTPVGARQITSFMKGAAQPGLNCGDIEKFAVPMPSTLSEQTAIATVLSDIDVELVTLEQRLAKTRALKQSMMQELLTGRTRLV